MKVFLKYSFVILLALTCAIAVPFLLKHAGETPPRGGTTAELQTVPAESESAAAAETTAETTAETETEETAAETTKAPAPPTFMEVSGDYFADALLIGDSRTVGLSEYGGLNNATYFADVGMSSFNVLTKKLTVTGMGETDLPSLLASRKFGKIYLMLGINEMGDGCDSVFEQYSDVVSQLRAVQPDAVLFVEANLHVTAEKSSADSVFNNPNIDYLNGKIASLADGQNVFYLDANPLFDDGSGNLNPDLSGDGIHVYGVGYQKWGEWLLTMGIVR